MTEAQFIRTKATLLKAYEENNLSRAQSCVERVVFKGTNSQFEEITRIVTAHEHIVTRVPAKEVEELTSIAS